MKTDTDPDSHRLQMFSDAVFAFACTLLVVSLEVPKSFEALQDDLRGFVAFGLAFAALTYIWSIHHRIFRRYPLGDDWSVLLNACLLFVVLFFVYPLKFLCVQLVENLRAGGDPVSSGGLPRDELRSLFMIYGSAYASIFLLFATLCWHGARVELRRQAEKSRMRRPDNLARHYLTIACVAGLSALVAWTGWGIQIGLPGWTYFLIAPATWANGVLSRQRPLA